MSLLIFNAVLYTAGAVISGGWLRIEGSRIHSFGAGAPPVSPDRFDESRLDAGGKRVLPGFIDLHVHGALGYDFMDAGPADMAAMAGFFASHGVTGFLATTWAAPPLQAVNVLTVVKQFMKENETGSRCLGVHLEGPFLNREYSGAQRTDFIYPASPHDALALLDTGLVRLITLAPEIPENAWLIEECLRRSIVVSAGHTAASYDQIVIAYQAGVHQVTHCFNAMQPFHHRQPGTVGAALTLPEMRCELIADLIHAHPAAVQILWKCKQPSGIILVTDAIKGAGLPDGQYRIDGRQIAVQGNRATMENGTLAGSVLTMDRALQNLHRVTGEALEKLWPASSLNAATALGLDKHKGSILPGKDADLVLIDESFNVWATFVEGQVVYSRDKLE